MYKINSNQINKSSSLPEDIRLDLDQKEQKVLDFVREVANIAGVTCRVAGGWVRDKLLNVPSKDLDITVEGMKGTEFAHVLRNHAIQTFGEGQKVIGRINENEARPDQIKNLSVAFLRIFGEEVELLPLRGNEVYESGSRNPISVDFDATPEQDAFRRDLTINSLFYNVNNGRIEDYTGKGYDDLASMTLRTPLDPIDTFRDDPLRVLRVLRFQSRYPNSRVAQEVIEAMADEEVQNNITARLYGEDFGIVPERIATEFIKLMQGKQPEKAIRAMYETGLLQKLLNLPEDFHPLHMDQRNKHHNLIVIEHLIQMLKNTNDMCMGKYDRQGFEFRQDDETRAMMNISALFHDIGKLDPRSHKEKADGSMGYAGGQHPESMTHQESSALQWKRFAKSLKLSNDFTESVFLLVSGHMDPHGHVENRQGPISDKALRKFKRKDLHELLYIHAMADAMSKSYEPDESRLDPYLENMTRMRNLDIPQEQTPELLNGQEIMQIVQRSPKPPAGMRGYIEVVKSHIDDMRLGNPNLTKEEAIAEVQRMVSQGEFDMYNPL